MGSHDISRIMLKRKNEGVRQSRLPHSQAEQTHKSSRRRLVQPRNSFSVLFFPCPSFLAVPVARCTHVTYVLELEKVVTMRKKTSKFLLTSLNPSCYREGILSEVVFDSRIWSRLSLRIRACIIRSFASLAPPPTLSPSCFSSPSLVLIQRQCL